MTRMAAAIVTLFLAVSSFALAQEVQQFGQALGDLYLSFDPVSRQPEGSVTGSEEFDFYLVTYIDYTDIGRPDLNATNGLWGWEAQMYYPPEVTIIRRTKNPPSSIEVCDCSDPYSDGFCVGTDATIPPMQPFHLVHWTGLLLQPAADELTFWLDAVCISSFETPSGPGAVPGWLEAEPMGECTGYEGRPIRCLRPFASWQDSLTLHVTVAVGDGSWSTLKARY